MTKQDLNKIKFGFVSYTAYLHLGIWESVDYEPRITVCTRTHVKDDSIFSKSISHYIFNGKTYKTKKKLLEAITAFEEERKSKFEKHG